MSVVNVKVRFIRPEYQNLRDWMDDPNNVYIGRAGIVFIDGERFPKRASIFANPFKIKKGGMTREDVHREYVKYAYDRFENDPEFREELLNLEGKTLGCWCKPELCHGDVLLEIITFWKSTTKK